MLKRFIIEEFFITNKFRSNCTYRKKDNLNIVYIHSLDANADPIPLWIHQILRPPKLEFTEDDKGNEKNDPILKCNHQGSEK